MICVDSLIIARVSVTNYKCLQIIVFLAIGSSSFLLCFFSSSFFYLELGQLEFK